MTDSHSAAIAQPATPPFGFSDDETYLIVEGVDFADFYRKERSGLVAFVVNHGADHQEASDAVQTAFAAVLPPRWETIREPRAYLRKAALREYYRSAPRAVTTVELTEEDVATALTGGSPPLDIVEAAEGVQWVISALTILPLKQRQVMAWHIDGYSHAEIAKHLCIPVTAVRKNFSRAKQTLQDYHSNQRREAG
ncbi:sigma-70 family RNA polymerase sigma factor [Nonomuraea sp. NPDC003804]|uniref:RNA polymerase sigma factor n=1 Tax=Nonomuraea sp. NPDC003804 TaxID=3154547 RepID=UPI0033A2CA3D